MSRTDKTRRFTIESLEHRRLMAADTMGAGQIYGPLPADTTPAAITFPNPFPDYTINYKVIKSEFDTTKNQLVIDGSDADDHIKILQFTPGATNDVVRVQMSRWDGQTLLSTRTENVNCGKLDKLYGVRVIGKDGHDEITNNTSLQMRAGGDNGSDTIQAGFSGDAIQGGPGRNYLYGGIGQDQITGGNERDIIVGGAGDDILYGEGGPDDIWGDYSTGDLNNAYIDRIHGGAGDDVLWGGAGNDLIWGDDGRDTIFGGYGDDTAWGGNGNDTLYGQQGRDTLFGENDTDTVDGGDDDDYKLDGGFGTSTNSSFVTADTIVGGQGRDKFVRHSSAFSFNEGDDLVDFNSTLGDTVETFYHW
jgi:Ca2+-binding RTX toxin-like protein